MRYKGSVTGKIRNLKSIYRFQILSGNGKGAKFDIAITDTNNDKRFKVARDKLISVLQDFQIIQDPESESIGWIFDKNSPPLRHFEQYDHVFYLYDSINGVID